MASFFLQNPCQNESHNSYEKTMNFELILASILAPFWYPKCIENHIKNIIDFGIDFGTILAPKMAPKMEPKPSKSEIPVPIFYFQKRFVKKASFFYRFWNFPGLRVATFWSILGSFWPPQALQNLHKFSPTLTETKTHQELAANTPRIYQEPPRTRRDPLRTFQGPAVRTPSRNISHNATAKKRLRSATNDREKT